MAQRTQPPPEPTVGVSRAVGASAPAVPLGTAAGTAAGVAATAPAVAGLLATAKTAQEGTEAVLAALEGFMALARAREDAWLVRTLKKLDGISQQDILNVVADENARRAEFDRRVRARVERDVRKALQDDDPKARLARIRDVLARERGYAEQRTAAMAVRGLALADRLVLRRTSPQGAYWKLGQAEKHTPDCVAMAGHVWPWAVLDKFAPPTHTGCVCSLHSYSTAVGNGWVKAGDLMDTAVALQRAAAARLLLHEGEASEMRDTLIAHGMTTGEAFDAAILEAGGFA